jgi:uncharacterized membrane protein
MDIGSLSIRKWEKFAMVDNWSFAVTLVSAVGCALVAGIFFAFSNFVMRALARLPTAQGIEAMQSIDITVINPMFMAAFFGSGLACIVATWLNWHQPNANYMLAGTLFYWLGTLGVTMLKNVPLNDALAKTESSSTEGAKLWTIYLADWTFWNHVRTAAALVAAVLLLITFIG